VFHSKADAYVPYDIMTDLIARKREAGGQVEYTLWEDGDHVALFRDHNQEYSSRLESFVNEAESAYWAAAPNTIQSAELPRDEGVEQPDLCL